jgi:hypothetical protein
MNNLTFKPFVPTTVVVVVGGSLTAVQMVINSYLRLMQGILTEREGGSVQLTS